MSDAEVGQGHRGSGKRHSGHRRACPRDGRDGMRRFCRFGQISLPARTGISRPNPTEPVVAGWQRPRSFQKWCDKVPLACAQPSTHGTRNRRIVSPSGHCAGTGDHRLHQTTKSWFRRYLTYRDNSFPPNHARRGTFYSRFEGYLARISNTVLVGTPVRTEHEAQNYSLHVAIKNSLA